MSETPGTEQYADAARRYRLDSRIATGGMGVVWRATDTRLNRTVALKVLKHEYADDTTFRTRFETEARHAASLHHPGIAGVFDYQATPSELAPGGAPYLVMELVEGAPLSTLLVQARDAGRTLDVDVVRDLIAQAAEALGVAHAAGIVHRDVKPANLLVTPEGQVKITDFGIARAGDAAQITRTGAVMGTPQYLSPEQARGNPSTPASDVYALGVVTFECLTGRRPFEADSPVATALAHLQQPVPELPPEIPPALAGVVRRALSKKPEERFRDGNEFAAALRDPSGFGAAGTMSTLLADPPTRPTTQISRPTVVGPPPPPMPVDDRLTPAAADPGDEDERPPRSPWLAVLLVLVLVAAAVIVAFLLLGGDDEGGDTDTVDSPTTSQGDDRRRNRDRETDPTSETTTEETTSEPTEETSEPTSEPPTSEPTEEEPETVEVDPGDYIDQPVDQVEADLESLGLRVQRSEVENDGSHVEGTVSGVNPSGTVEVGDVVTVTYYGAPPETEEPPADPAERENG